MDGVDSAGRSASLISNLNEAFCFSPHRLFRGRWEGLRDWTFRYHSRGTPLPREMSTWPMTARTAETTTSTTWRWRTRTARRFTDAVRSCPMCIGSPRRKQRMLCTFPIVRAGRPLWAARVHYSGHSVTSTTLEPSSVSHHHQVCYPDHQATGYIFPWTLLTTVTWPFNWRPYLKCKHRL